MTSIWKGTDGVKEVILNTSQQGRQWAKIVFACGLDAATFSESAIAEAQGAFTNGTPLAFIGSVTAREYQGKHYPNLTINTAWEVGRVEVKANASDAGGSDLPF